MIECVVFCEARADAEIAQMVVDRVLCDASPWVEDVIDHMRRWHGDDRDGRRFVKWTDLKRRSRGIRVHGRYGGPNKGEYVQARKALAYAAKSFPDANAVALSRDDDGKDRRPDFEAARRHARTRRAIVIALARPTVEAWCIVAFHPTDDTEQARLDETTAELHGDPRAIAHTLKHESGHPRSIKPVLNALCADDRHRALDGLRTASLDTLRARGESVGLTAFIDDVREHFAPLIGAAPSTP